MQLHTQSIKYIYHVAWNLRSVQQTLLDFVDMRVNAMNNTSTHVIKKTIQTQWFFKLREYSIKKRRFIFCRWKLCYKVFKYNGPSIGLTDFVRLCCSVSECDKQHGSDIRPWHWRIDFKISELVVGELTRWRNDRNPLICEKTFILNHSSTKLFLMVHLAAAWTVI